MVTAATSKMDDNFNFNFKVLYNITYWSYTILIAPWAKKPGAKYVLKSVYE